MLLVGDRDSYGNAYGHVGMICNGLADALCMLIQFAVIVFGK